VSFALKTGLTVRCGERTLEVVRLLGNEEVQLEEVLTRKPIVISTNELLKRIWTKRYTVVYGTGCIATRMQNDSGDPAKEAERLLPSDVDIGALPAAWQAEIQYRLGYLKVLQAGHIRRGERGRIEKAIARASLEMGHGKGPSASSVMDWARAYETSGHNPLALLSKKKLVPRSRRLPDEVEATISSVLKREYFTTDRHPLRHAHDCIKRELAKLVEQQTISANEADVSFTTLHRRTRDVDLYARIASREGDQRARYVCRTSMDGASASYPLQRVEVDHTPLNWVVICDRTGLPLGRPMLTVAVDAYSGYVLGFYISFCGTGVSSVTGVLRNAFEVKDELIKGMGLKHRWLSHGLGDEWVLDNGLEFHAKQFRQICWQLGIDMTYCRVRTPWLKPHVERFFASLNYIGLAKGRVHKKVANAITLDPYKDACIRFSDLVRGLTKFVVDVHPFTVNERKLARPHDLFLEGMERCPPALFPGSIQELRMIAGLSRTLTVHQGGVDLVGLPYGGAELQPLRERYGRPFKTLCKWDPDDLSTMFIQDPDHPTEWFTSPCRWSEYAAGLSWNQHQLIRKFKRLDLRNSHAEEVLWAARLELHEHWQNAARPATKADSLLAARFSGVTSSKVFEGKPLDPPAPSRVVVSAAESVMPADVDVPEFESFNMEAA
jgi:putative transposase